MVRPVGHRAAQAEGEGVGGQVGVGGGGGEGEERPVQQWIALPMAPSTGATLTSLTVTVMVSQPGWLQLSLTCTVKG